MRDVWNASNKEGNRGGGEGRERSTTIYFSSAAKEEGQGKGKGKGEAIHGEGPTTNTLPKNSS